MKYKNPLTIIVVVAVVSAIGGVWTLVHGQSAAPRARSARATSSVSVPSNPYPVTSNLTTVYAQGAPGADDPEMAELAEAEAGLARESDELLSQYASSDDAAEQKKIKSRLREALAKQFDVQKQRRELELTRIEERIRKVREQLKKRSDARETIIDRRLDQLVNDAEGLGWGPAGGDDHIIQKRGSLFSAPRGR